MTPFRILIVAATVAALVIPASADAAHRTTRSHRTTAHTVVSTPKISTLLKTAKAVGRRYWGAVPCGGRMTFVARRRLAAGIDPATDAWVTFSSSLGNNNLASPAGTYQNCVISLARWRWPTAGSMAEDWDMLCTTMVHEMGHLLGHAHDSRHGSVMAPVFTDSSSVPKSCKKTRPRAAR